MVGPLRNGLSTVQDPGRRRYPTMICRLLLLLVALGPSAAFANPEPIEPLAEETTEPPPRPFLRVVTKPITPFSMPQDDGSWVGFTIDLWGAIAREIGVDYEVIGMGSNPELITAIEAGEADVAAAGMTVTAERERRIDFSHPFLNSGLRIMVTGESTSTVLTVARSVLPGLLKLVAVLLAVLLLAAHVMWLVERGRTPGVFSKKYLPGIWDSIWWAAVTMTTVGYGDRVPQRAAGRVVALIWMFIGIVFISSFTATVTTSLTVQHLEGTINGPEDLGGRKVGTVRGTTSSDFLRERGVRVVEYAVIEDAYPDLLAGELEAVVYDWPALVYYARTAGAGQVSVVGEVFERQSYGMGLARNSPYRDDINQAILSLQEKGTYAELRDRWFSLEDQ